MLALPRIMLYIITSECLFYFLLCVCAKAVKSKQQTNNNIYVRYLYTQKKETEC